MTSRTLRLAYRLLRIAALADRVKFLKKKYPEDKIDPEKIDELAKLDPTGGRFLEWLVRVFIKKSAPSGFWNAAPQVLTMYAEIIKSPTLAEMYGVSRDINKMDPKDLHGIWARESEGIIGFGKESYASEALRAKKVKQEGSRVIYDQNGYRVIQFGGSEMDPKMAIEALCMFGAGTEWCTRKSNQAASYLWNGPVYMVFRGDSKVAQVNKDQIQDTSHNDISLRKSPELTQVLVGSGIINPQMAYNLLASGAWRSGSKDPWPELEPALAGDLETAFAYASRYLHGRFPLGEKVIAQDPNTAYLYATIVLQDRFPEGEEAILSHHEFGPKYQKEFLT